VFGLGQPEFVSHLQSSVVRQLWSSDRLPTECHGLAAATAAKLTATAATLAAAAAAFAAFAAIATAATAAIVTAVVIPHGRAAATRNGSGAMLAALWQLSRASQLLCGRARWMLHACRNPLRHVHAAAQCAVRNPPAAAAACAPAA